MIFRTNAWNRFRYTLYTPVYDAIGRWFAPYRRQSIDQLAIQPGERVLLIGAGTGLDLEHIPKGADILATDLTPLMVQQIKVRNRLLGHQLEVRVMDGQNLDLDAQSVDVVILHLILAVIPDPVACLREAERVLKPGGRIGIMDKFLPPGEQAPMWRRWTNIFTFILATDINRRFEPILDHTGLELVSDEQVAWRGNLRVIQLRAPLSTPLNDQTNPFRIFTRDNLRDTALFLNYLAMAMLFRNALSRLVLSSVGLFRRLIEVPYT